MLTQPSPCPVLFAASNMNLALSIILLDYCERSSIALPIVGLPLIHHSSTSVLGGSHEVRQKFFHFRPLLTVFSGLLDPLPFLRT